MQLTEEGRRTGFCFAAGAAGAWSAVPLAASSSGFSSGFLHHDDRSDVRSSTGVYGARFPPAQTRCKYVTTIQFVTRASLAATAARHARYKGAPVADIDAGGELCALHLQAGQVLQRVHVVPLHRQRLVVLRLRLQVTCPLQGDKLIRCCLGQALLSAQGIS